MILIQKLTFLDIFDLLPPHVAGYTLESPFKGHKGVRWSVNTLAFIFNIATRSGE